LTRGNGWSRGEKHEHKAGKTWKTLNPETSFAGSVEKVGPRELKDAGKGGISQYQQPVSIAVGSVLIGESPVRSSYGLASFIH
jgi:hypothetical protein